MPADLYRDFAELTRHRREGRDFHVVARAVPGSAVAVVAPHGGHIEPHTSEMARDIAAEEHSLYIFSGDLQERGNFEMHITSVRFDEPRALALVAESQTTLTIHGCRGAAPAVYLSGLDAALEEKFCAAFNKAGIRATIEGHPYKMGRDPENICNKNRSGTGVQIEFTRALRDDDALRQKAVRVVRDVLRSL